jgi:alkaline phosphatase
MPGDLAGNHGEDAISMRKGKRMRLRRMIVMLAAVAGVSLGLPSAMPAAHAASAAPAAHLIARAPAAAQAASASTAQTSKSIPFIQFRECSGTTTSWVDIDILLPGGLQDWCFGYTGTWTFSRNYDVTNFCAGNNDGHFSYYLPDDQLTGFSFGPRI